MKPNASSIWKSLSSIRLAVGLLVVLALGSIVASLVPQGRPEEFYTGHLPKLLAYLVLAAGFDRYFTSPLFLFPALGFFINLSACTLNRLLRELRKSAGRRFGPDILHIGLLALMIGAAVSFSGRQEGSVQLRPGDKVELPDGYLLSLLDFTYLKYDDGRPRDWISRVRIEKAGVLVRDSFEIRVNQPLEVASLKIYQTAHGESEALVLKDDAGAEQVLPRGERKALPDASAIFMTSEKGLAVVNWKDARGSSVERVKAGDRLGGYEVLGLRSTPFTGLQAVSDPGYPLVAGAFLLVLVGLSLTFLQKLFRKES